MVTSSPPATMPLVKSNGANTNPTSPAIPNKIQFPHNTNLSKRCCVVIRLFHLVYFFDGKVDIIESCHNPETQEQKHQPWRGTEYLVQEQTDKQADKNGQGHGKTEGAVPAQLLYHLPGFFFHGPTLKAGFINLLKFTLLT